MKCPRSQYSLKGVECVSASVCTDTKGGLLYTNDADTEKRCLVDEVDCKDIRGYVLNNMCLTNSQCREREGIAYEIDSSCYFEIEECPADEYGTPYDDCFDKETCNAKGRLVVTSIAEVGEIRACLKPITCVDIGGYSNDTHCLTKD